MFSKAGFTKKDEVDTDSDNGSTEDPEMSNLFDQAAKALCVSQTLQEYVGIDNEIPATEHLSLKEIAAHESKTMPTSTFEEREEEEDAVQAVVSTIEVENAMSTLWLYLQQHENTTEELGLLDSTERRLGTIFSASIQYQVFL